MKSWKLNWIKNEAFAVSEYKKHRRQLKSPIKFYWAVMAKAIPNFWKKPIYLKLRNGGKFMVVDFMTLYIYKEIFADGCYDFSDLDENPAIIDVGANTGLFALRMKQLYPKSKIYCFEPFAPNNKQLRDNIAMSGYKDISVFQQGVGGTTRTEKLFIHKTNVGGHSIIKSETGSDEFEKIDIVSLKEVFKNNGIVKCSLLKLDCEGAEYEILKSIDSELAAQIDKIIFEPTRSLYDVEELRTHLTSVGFSFEDKGLCYAFKK